MQFLELYPDTGPRVGGYEGHILIRALSLLDGYPSFPDFIDQFEEFIFGEGFRNAGLEQTGKLIREHDFRGEFRPFQSCDPAPNLICVTNHLVMIAGEKPLKKTLCITFLKLSSSGNRIKK